MIAFAFHEGGAFLGSSLFQKERSENSRIKSQSSVSDYRSHKGGVVLTESAVRTKPVFAASQVGRARAEPGHVSSSDWAGGAFRCGLSGKELIQLQTGRRLLNRAISTSHLEARRVSTDFHEVYSTTKLKMSADHFSSDLLWEITRMCPPTLEPSHDMEHSCKVAKSRY